MSNERLDQARDVREDEQLDAARVHEWLSSQVDGLPADPPEIRQFPGGASNLTYLLRYPDRELILRRPPFGHKAKSAHDMVREYRVQAALKPVYPVVPDMVALCTDESVMGCDFYVMERIRGMILRSDLPEGMSLSPEQARQLCYSLIDNLVRLHRVDYHAAGLESLGKGAGYVERQIRGWSDRCEKSKTWKVPVWRRVRDWLHANMPEDVDTCIIHNDYRFDNLVLDPENPQQIIGVLDWEMATLGDPLMELGCVLSYWVHDDDDRLYHMLRRQPTNLSGMLRREEVVEYYCDQMKLKPDNWTFYEVYGLFRLAVILQQIYYRYHHGQTRNPAFRTFWIASHYLHHRSKRLIRRAG